MLHWLKSVLVAPVPFWIYILTVAFAWANGRLAEVQGDFDPSTPGTGQRGSL